MNIYKILSVLLCYPEQELIDSIPAIDQALTELQIDSAYIQPLLKELATADLITLQENYVQTFDRNPSQSLHLFEHIHGEDRIRGQAMVDLMQEYQNDGFVVAVNELPDYLPLFLEYLAVSDTKKSTELLGEAIDVIGHIESKLSDNNSIYAGIFKHLISLSPIQPKPLVTPPIRDMDEALEKFGPSPEGVEPLLQLNTSSACITCESSARQVK